MNSNHDHNQLRIKNKFFVSAVLDSFGKTFYLQIRIQDNLDWYSVPICL
jgi:hypothetical protein